MITKPQLTFLEALNTAASQLTVFRGRSRRSEFWWWALLIFVASFVLSINVRQYSVEESFLVIIEMLLMLTVTIRRLHDSGKSGLWLWLFLAFRISNQVYASVSGVSWELRRINQAIFPAESDYSQFVNLYGTELMIVRILTLATLGLGITVLIMCLVDSAPGDNKYGPSPKYIDE